MNLVAEWPPAPALVSPQPPHIWVSLSDMDRICTLGHRQGLCLLEDLCSIKRRGTPQPILWWGRRVSLSPGVIRGCDLLLADTLGPWGCVAAPHTQPCNPTMGCRAHRELQVGGDDCCLLQLLEIHGASMGGEAGWGSDKDLVPGRRGISCRFGGERQLSQQCLAGVRRRVPAPPAKSRGLFVFQRGCISKM